MEKFLWIQQRRKGVQFNMVKYNKLELMVLLVPLLINSIVSLIVGGPSYIALNIAFSFMVSVILYDMALQSETPKQKMKFCSFSSYFFLCGPLIFIANCAFSKKIVLEQGFSGAVLPVLTVAALISLKNTEKKFNLYYFNKITSVILLYSYYMILGYLLVFVFDNDIRGVCLLSILSLLLGLDYLCGYRQFANRYKRGFFNGINVFIFSVSGIMGLIWTIYWG